MQRSTWALCLLCGLDGAGALSIWTPTARGRRTGPIAAVASDSRSVQTSDTADRAITADELTIEWDHCVSWRSASEAAELIEKYGVCCMRGVHDPAVVEALRDTVLRRFETCKAAITKKGMQMTDAFAYNEICHEINNSKFRYDLRLSTRVGDTCLAEGKVRTSPEPSPESARAFPRSVTCCLSPVGPNT